MRGTVPTTPDMVHSVSVCPSSFVLLTCRLPPPPQSHNNKYERSEEHEGNARKIAIQTEPMNNGPKVVEEDKTISAGRPNRMSEPDMKCAFSDKINVKELSRSKNAGSRNSNATINAELNCNMNGRLYDVAPWKTPRHEKTDTEINTKTRLVYIMPWERSPIICEYPIIDRVHVHLSLIHI